MASYTYAPKGKQTLSDFNIFLQLNINLKGLTVSKAIICYFISYWIVCS